MGIPILSPPESGDVILTFNVLDNPCFKYSEILGIPLSWDFVRGSHLGDSPILAFPYLEVFPVLSILRF